MPQTEFGRQLQKLREQSGLSREQLAKSAGLNTGSLANLENGARTPSWPTVQALADALGVSLDEFREKPKKRR